MDHPRLGAAVLAAAMIMGLPAVAGAQAETPATPEGVSWILTAYQDDVTGEMVGVPFGVAATLRLQDGIVTGSGGCNDFSGNYEVDGTSLQLNQELAVTLALCDEELQSIEDAYLAAIGEVATWALGGSGLELRGALDTPLLVFEAPGPGLTPSQLARLTTWLEAADASVADLGSRVDAIGIARLRDRIKQLEAANQRLQQQVADLSKEPRTRPTTSFSATEPVLLEGVPARIASTCEPLRQRLPTGTAAAVQCQPNTTSVTEMAYYLLEAKPAVKLFEDRMKAGGATPLEIYGPPGTPTCADGSPSWFYADGGGISALGCYVDSGRSNVRIIQDATACKQLDVGNRRLKRPVMYVAMSGAGTDIVPLYDWAVRGRGVIETIDRPRGKKSPGVGCP